MSAQHNTTGREGEDLAASFLARRGLKVIDRNVRTARGEIDIVARDGRQIVFVEVKTRRSRGFGSGLEAVGADKQARLLAAGQIYMRSRREKSLRFDVLCVFIGPNAAPVFNLVENAFGG